MLIDHPLLGPRDAREFVYLGDASLIDRPDPDAFAERDEALDAFVDWLYLRDNPAGLHEELWFHEQGDRSWLVVTRDTTTHEIHDVRLAREVALERGRGERGRGQALERGRGERGRGQALERGRGEQGRGRTIEGGSGRGAGQAPEGGRDR